ncbi:MAG: hypothetical protein VB035_05570 [Candidatus Fimivivens sp.]|nr:hypothetical protein [Candidatus Fimivivens sp.]
MDNSKSFEPTRELSANSLTDKPTEISFLPFSQRELLTLNEEQFYGCNNIIQNKVIIDNY